ncbi:enoyl-CoA hydratase/isomerase family protein [Flavobacterium sp. MK4S-17]|uniref:enoyl-CoA hydratase/isomerase family protein n=1 Tax=Flavobacterium sp. MK4S-17 TaxID=2543737 RepID=UPI00135AD056|nr:enoyl-CoA hydratase/isomerase family protein [Flavobacterium sp. MK4S-17]
MDASHNNGYLKTDIINNVATLTFSHPASNSFPSYLLQQLTEELEKLSHNADAHIIVLKSDGEKAFCAGASFNELLEVSNYDEGARFFSGFANVINAMRTYPKLIIGRVQGKAVGGGVGLAAACDYALATTDSAVKLSEFTIGIGPFVIAPAVERKMGKAALTEMTIAAHEWKSAQWAQEKGLYAKVFSTIAELDNEVKNLAEKLAGYNPEALNAMKKVLWEGTENWDALLAERAKVSGRLVLSEATKKALSGFKK